MDRLPAWVVFAQRRRRGGGGEPDMSKTHPARPASSFSTRSGQKKRKRTMWVWNDVPRRASSFSLSSAKSVWIVTPRAALHGAASHSALFYYVLAVKILDVVKTTENGSLARRRPFDIVLVCFSESTSFATLLTGICNIGTDRFPASSVREARHVPT